MFSIKNFIAASIIACFVSFPVIACTLSSTTPVDGTSTTSAQYSWTMVTERAAFPGSYNFPVFTMGDQIWAFHPEGNWYSSDGRNWTKSELPPAGLNAAYQKYVKFNNAVYALGTMTGNYLNLQLTSRIARTTDFKRWEVIAEHSELPARVFYGAIVFKNKIWLMGGFDGKNYYNDVWSSDDAVHWNKVKQNAAWSKRTVASPVIFRDRLWLIGGGVINGTPSAEVWSSTDGVDWQLETDKLIAGGSAIVFEDKLWLVGANRDGNFSRAVLASNDGVTWREETAPWSPRGGVAAWVFDNKLFMTGGKFSETENGQIKFIYRNDVWCLSRSAAEHSQSKSELMTRGLPDRIDLQWRSPYDPARNVE